MRKQAAIKGAKSHVLLICRRYFFFIYNFVQPNSIQMKNQSYTTYRLIHSNFKLISNENYTWENKWQMKLCDEWGQIISSSSHWLRNKVDSSFYIAIYIYDDDKITNCVLNEKLFYSKWTSLSHAYNTAPIIFLE